MRNNDELTTGHSSSPSWPGKTLLGRLAPASQTALLDLCRWVDIGPGERLLSQGAENSHAVLLGAGSVKVLLLEPGGSESLLAVRQRGDLVGELAAMSGEPRTASVVAVGDVRAGLIAGSALRDLLAKRPDVALALIRALGERLMWANSRRVEFTAYSAEAKIAHVLGELAVDAEVEDGAFRIRLSQQDLASIVGIALNTTQTALRSLAAAGLVMRGYREVLVPDVPALLKFEISSRTLGSKESS